LISISLRVTGSQIQPDSLGTTNGLSSLYGIEVQTRNLPDVIISWLGNVSTRYRDLNLINANLDILKCQKDCVWVIVSNNDGPFAVPKTIFLTFKYIKISIN
jgi:hypothetical protein